jgi:rhodanese-related sulfurtransferase
VTPSSQLAYFGEAVFESVDDLLETARRSLRRLDVAQTVAALDAGSRLVDIRPAWQRVREGEIAGSLIVERNHLEWRLHPRSSARLSDAVVGQHWIVVCAEGYTSSLAAAALVSLGVPATDLIGGVAAWRATGRPVVPGPTAVERIVGAIELDELPRHETEQDPLVQAEPDDRND